VYLAFGEYRRERHARDGAKDIEPNLPVEGTLGEISLSSE
jgi:hypothetical protein